MRRRIILPTCAALLLLAGCGTAEAPDTAGAPDAGAPDDGAGAPDDGFDADTARVDAEALLGLPEDELEETPDRRIVRRGDEEYTVTMDLRPGRENVELDDDGTGTYVVTRVVVETPEGGDDNIVVEADGSA